MKMTPFRDETPPDKGQQPTYVDRPMATDKDEVAWGKVELARLLTKMRPRLHRYCARMTGSVIDGEDALQEGLTKVLEAAGGASEEDGADLLSSLARPDGWIFRVVHHATLDLLRRRRRELGFTHDEEGSTMTDIPSDFDARVAAAAHLATFMRLPAAQRSCVILMDVLGHSLAEIVAITGASLPAVKASLHRGRARLRELGGEPEATVVPTLGDREKQLLAVYVERFNARDFEAVRDMLADEVRVDVVERAFLQGKGVVARTYFGNYADTTDWIFAPGLVEGRTAILAYDPAQPSAGPRYFVLLDWRGDELVYARDFRHAAYDSMEGTTFVRL